MNTMRFAIQDCSLTPVRERYGLFGSFQQIKKCGFDGVEFAVWDKTLAEMHGHSARDIKLALADAGVEAVGIHVDLDRLDSDPGATLDECHELGIPYAAICPAFYGDRTPFAQQKALYAKVVRVARLMKQNGIQFQTHCAALGYLKDYKSRSVVEGMMEEAGLSLLQPEFDTAWMVCGGVDPAETIRKYAGFVDLIHIKDFLPRLPNTPYIMVRHNTVADEGLGCVLGQGVVKIPDVIEAARESGTKWLIGEFWDGEDVLEEARQGLAYMKTLV